MKTLINNSKTLCISSLSKDNLPCISYSPFVWHKNKAYIYISKVAEHYKNLVDNKKISIMFIQPENEAEVTFLRKRVCLNGIAEIITQELSEDIIKMFRESHGNQIMDTLTKMDFDVFEISSTKGRLVEGYGKAYDLILKEDNWEKMHVVIDKSK
ncbi:MAG: pyridoxamine 5'-phosphate oxidase family protein [Oscillospiraceae bacterium]|nr:pyridoxamine 5'-phosphate oxidase family protein [Oscillospiraceae bacterium]